MSSVKPKAVKGKRTKTIMLIVVLVLLVCLTAAFLGFRYYTGMLNYQSVEYGGTSHLADNDSDSLTDNDVANILLIGADGDSDTDRSDTMLLVSINKSTQKIVMTSFLRDIYLPITGYGSDRLNAALVYGGTSLLIETLEGNFGVKIDSYAKVGFSEFENIIDALGGVTMELTDEEVSYLELGATDDNTYFFDGAWALRFSRIRKLDSDFGRTDRQRRLLTEIMKEFKSAGIGELNSLLTSVLPEIVTNLTEKDLLGMITSWSSYSKYDIETSTIPIDGSYEDISVSGMDVLDVDFNANRDYLAESIYGSTD